MKKLVIIILIIILQKASLGQNMVLKYAVAKDVETTIGSGGEKKTSTLNYNGYLYKKNNRYIYFERPAFKQKIENGSITVSGPDKNLSLLTINTDSLQAIVYSDYDSAVQRMSKIDDSKRNLLSNFEAEWWPWKLLSDTKQINGLRCQKAIHTGRNGTLEWEIWFCADIPMQAGVFMIKSLPGMVVEANFIPMHKSYVLISHETVSDIADEIFWPNEFNGFFIKTNDLKKTNASDVRKPTKVEKQDELLKNNQ